MKKLCALLLVNLAVAMATSFSQILYTGTGNVYNETFNSLGTNSSSAWTNNVSVAGWFALAPLTNPVVIANQTGTGVSGTLANFGSTAAATDRSLGWVYANSVGVAGTFASIGFGISNVTGLALSSFSLAYTGREWRGYSNNTPVLSFQYKIGGTFDNDSTNSLSGNTAWTDFSGLNFVLPVTNNNLRVDGSVAPNFTSISNEVSGLSWLDNEVLWVRWRQQNLSGTDAQMALDDISFTAVPEPGTYALLALAGAGFAFYRLRRRARH